MTKESCAIGRTKLLNCKHLLWISFRCCRAKVGQSRSMTTNHSVIFLFDVDGTLTKSRQKIDPVMSSFLKDYSKNVPLAVVGGSDIAKITEQLGDSIEDLLSNYEYVFAENGLVAFRKGQLLENKTIIDQIGEEKLQKFINFCLHYISQIWLPAKRGNFVEFRKGMLNVSPIGRSCSQKEREAFVEYDQVHKIREKFIEEMRRNFPVEEYGLQFSIGGQISIDAFPVGWDKTYCLKYLLQDGFRQIHFFGDKTAPGGNDYEIYADERTIGHSVTSPDDTMTLLTKLSSQLHN